MHKYWRAVGLLFSVSVLSAFCQHSVRVSEIMLFDTISYMFSHHGSSFGLNSSMPVNIAEKKARPAFFSAIFTGIELFDWHRNLVASNISVKHAETQLISDCGMSYCWHPSNTCQTSLMFFMFLFVFSQLPKDLYEVIYLLPLNTSQVCAKGCPA